MAKKINGLAGIAACFLIGGAAFAQTTTTVTEEGSSGAAISGSGGAVAGAIVGGPVGALVGGAAGIVAGAAIDPPERTVTYVQQNPVPPVVLEGEVVTGAVVPEVVVLEEIPESEYRYAYINGQPVLVEAETRQIVYVLQ